MKGLIKLLKPQVFCLNCERPVLNPAPGVESLCLACWNQLPHLGRDLCDLCGHVHLGSGCSDKPLIQIGVLRALFLYKDPVSRWVAALKYGRDFSAGRMLKSILAQWAQENQQFLSEYDAIVPVPVHPLRLIKRGFNQAAYLADSLQPAMRLAKKTRHTPHQAGLPGEKRYSNLVRSFGARDVKDKKILIFDDVCTTGQTIERLAQAMREEGAQKVDALALCRTLGQKR